MARRILTTSSLLLAVLGLGCLFFPEASARVLSLPEDAASAVSLVGGGQLGFAVLNWIGRGAIYGGIYGRPLTLANFANGVITGSATLRVQLDGGTGLGWVVTAGLLLYLAAFVWLTFWPPYGADRPGTT